MTRAYGEYTLIRNIVSNRTHFLFIKTRNSYCFVYIILNAVMSWMTRTLGKCGLYVCEAFNVCVLFLVKIYCTNMIWCRKYKLICVYVCFVCSELRRLIVCTVWHLREWPRHNEHWRYALRSSMYIKYTLIQFSIKRERFSREIF